MSSFNVNIDMNFYFETTIGYTALYFLPFRVFICTWNTISYKTYEKKFFFPLYLSQRMFILLENKQTSYHTISYRTCKVSEARYYKLNYDKANFRDKGTFST